MSYQVLTTLCALKQPLIPTHKSIPRPSVIGIEVCIWFTIDLRSKILILILIFCRIFIWFFIRLLFLFDLIMFDSNHFFYFTKFNSKSTKSTNFNSNFTKSFNFNFYKFNFKLKLKNYNSNFIRFSYSSL